MTASTSTSLKSALENSLAQRVVPGDVSKPRQLSSFDGSQKGLLWNNKFCCYVPDVLVGLVLRIGDAEQASETFKFKCM
ncbi:hypothetical protein DPMN_071419 [Dreissena polymorpha]|uniref:Uncharacterized protein n=1 Tax=Dreissena polymorpha TaxID=45954 RepID=A0A9D3Z6P4_DREPO|nr:hypothetical protein DPMN_071419 [Dreissena polymorpha]